MDAIILIGGTGVAYSDVTVEAVEPLLDKVLSGFGEMFRATSFKEVGSSAFLSRALAGTVNGKAVFCLPGAPEAVRLAVKELIIPEIGHITKLIKS